MGWSRTDKTQTAAALFKSDIADFDTLFAELRAKPSVFLNCLIAKGDDWLALFGTRMENEIMLPHMFGAVALYEIGPGVWLPVGSKLSLPASIQNDYLEGLRADHDLRNPIIALPTFGPSDETLKADIFHLQDQVPLGSIAAAVPA